MAGGSLGISHERVAATGLAYLSATLGSPTQPSDTTAGAVNVTVNSGSDINTYGFGSSAVTAQSIGNGGGRVVGSDQITLNTYLGASLYGGYGGDVTVTSHGPIGINGQYSPAIIAQSIGGGGLYHNL